MTPVFCCLVSQRNGDFLIWEERMLTEASDTFLRSAMDFHRMVRIEIDSGFLVGYLIDFDEAAVILHAQFTAGETKEVQSGLTMVPRDKVMILTNRVVTDESKKFQEIYHDAREAK